MIREEVEKLRGYLFTKEEMEEIINPALVASRDYLEKVPTMEEYNDFRKRVGILYDMLDERIAKLEANEVFTDNVSVLIQIDRKDPNSSKGFDVIIDDGDEKKKYVINELDLRRQGVVYEGIYKIDYIGKHKFFLNDLKITCKYPVILRCYDCQVSKYIEPIIKE